MRVESKSSAIDRAKVMMPVLNGFRYLLRTLLGVLYWKNLLDTL